MTPPQLLFATTLSCVAPSVHPSQRACPINWHIEKWTPGLGCRSPGTASIASVDSKSFSASGSERSRRRSRKTETIAS